MRKFIFFEGCVSDLNMVARWEPDTIDGFNLYANVNIEEELTNFLSQQISDEIDRDIINTLTRTINRGQRA